MKKITIGILFLLLLLTIAYSYRNYNQYKVLKIIDASHLYIDLNQNLQIDDNELVKVMGIETFKDSKSVLNSNIDEKYNFVLDYFAKEWVEKNFLNKLVKFKKTDNNQFILYEKGNNYAVKVLKQGFGLSDTSEYKKYDNINLINDKIKEAESSNYVILNNKNKKYHTLDCKYGISSYEYKLIPLKQLPEGSSKCGYCHKNKYQKNNEQIAKTTVIDHKNIENINIYFMDFNNNKGPNNYCSSTACKSLLNEIQQAKYSIDFAIYGINKQPAIFNAIIAAKKRGVNIRWVTDFDSNSENYYPDTLKLMREINNFTVDNMTKNIKSSKHDKNALMHNKFFIFDKKKVWTGSANITDTDFSNFNANYSLLINSKNVAEIYTNEFEQLYNGIFHNLKLMGENRIISLGKNTKVSVYFSPQDRIINSQILSLIDNSKKCIYIPIFYLTHKELANHLIMAEKRGVEIKVITDATNSHGKYSVHKLLRSSGIKVKTENKAGKMHMKTILIDDKYSIVGSMNLTKSGETYNDENVLVIENTEITKYLTQTFLQMWNSIPDKYLIKDPRAEAPESIGSCTDGIDNDFDGLIDSLDNSCIYKKSNSK